MTEYQDAAHEAYRRLLWAQEHRPDPEELAKIAEAERKDAWQRKVARFRQSIA